MGDRDRSGGSILVLLLSVIACAGFAVYDGCEDRERQRSYTQKEYFLDRPLENVGEEYVKNEGEEIYQTE